MVAVSLKKKKKTIIYERKAQKYQEKIQDEQEMLANVADIVGEPKTQQRMQHMLMTKRPLRN